ncbi:MAG: PP2C family protein-serine/threonine phosphatase [bacterium]|nr:PP2C family protein-serine/threonine phosphatase [bacterium]
MGSGNPKFLIIDSNQESGGKLSGMLDRLGFASDNAIRMSDASKLMQKGGYDCILVDKSASEKWKKNLSELASHSSGSMVFLTGDGKADLDCGSYLETADGYFQINSASVTELGNHLRKAIKNKLAPGMGIAKTKTPVFMPRSLDNELLNDTQGIIRTRRIVRDSSPEDMTVVAQRDDGSYGILFGDFTGAEQMRNLQISHLKPRIHRSLLESHSPGQVLRSLNQDLLRSNGAVDFMTAVAALVNLKKNRLVYSIAGHMPILHRRWGSRQWKCLTGKGIPLGIRENLSCTSEILHTKPGDRVLLLSDGILKPHAIARKWLDIDNMLEDLDMLPIDSAPHEILERLGEMANPEKGAGLSDEFTAMLIQY